jgi:ubiquinone/menaquinone biosynthesis C-methylase UbiE
MIYKKEYIIEEYNSSAKSLEEHQKVKWGSRESMMNRFSLAMERFDFGKPMEWLDVGCGTGAFQESAQGKFPTLRGLAIDLNPTLLGYARKKNIQNIDFKERDFLELEDRQFDLITCFGVLQKSNFSLEQFFVHARRLLKAEGCVLADTKHLDWNKFLEPNFTPEPIHNWFTVKDIRQAINKSGLIEKEVFGFQPEKYEIVDPCEAHTLICIARNL